MPRVTITVPEKTPQPYRFQLDRTSVTLGRGSDNDIAIDCGSISVKHAEMLRIQGGYELRDVGSTNGIKLDGERMNVIPLTSGCSVKLGDVAFDFVLSDEEQDALSREAPAPKSPALPPMGENEIDLPAPKIAPQRPIAVSGDSGGGIWMILLFLILAAAAFFAGMAVRFQKETGGSLIDALQSRKTTVVVPAQAKPAPAVQETK
jgi:pSer/pThr/pTyr-binding forkhead associated (FHA) protein